MAGLAIGIVLLSATAAQAHPLGNFTVNHYNGISLHPDRVDVLAIVDTAEIPTAQEMPAIDTDGDGSASAAELTTYGAAQCQDVAAGVTVTVGGTAVPWTIGQTELTIVPGAASLPTLRLTCPLSGPADLSGPATVALTDTFRVDRVGWHEITAVGTGVRLINPTVSATTISDELRKYPNDLLSSPLAEKSVTLQTEPGEGSSGGQVSIGTSSPDPFSRAVAALDQKLQGYVGGALTPLVGVLALLLAFLLGAGHALLPGHGKTVIAAYLAGRSGSKKDAVVVGATVTTTHTAGVLILGVVLTAFTSVIGEQVLRRLGIISGLTVAFIGLLLLRTALKNRRRNTLAFSHAEALVTAGAPAGTEHDHPHPHDHEHEDEHHDHGHSEHGHDDHGHHDHGHHEHGHSHGLFGGHPNERLSRSSLIGMGVAGGLVPSPSALVVLLASIALGRTVFGVILVFIYGLGMATVLTAVGLLLVRVRQRMERSGGSGGISHRAAALTAALPIITSVLVLVVGLFLVGRGLLSTV